LSRRLEIRLGPAPQAYEGGDATRVFGLLGHPVSHSLSPRLQNAALRAAGLDATYLAFDVAPGELVECMARVRVEARSGRLGGLNVTLPHKQEVARLVDERDDASLLAGAVNTVQVLRDGAGASARVSLRGFDTDVAGLVAALAERGVRLGRARVLVVGAGGMARAAVVAALQEGAAEIRVANRSLERAQTMLDDVCNAWRGALPHVACAALEDAASLLDGAQVLVQATSLGLDARDPSPLSLATAPEGLFVLDSTYGSAESALLREARARGLAGTDGRALLLHQGAAAFQIWTGLAPAVDAMRKAVSAPAERAPKSDAASSPPLE
jgi:shikimate dehydrogenase